MVDREKKGRQTLGTCDNSAAARSDINTSYGFIVALQLILQLERIADFTIQLEGRVLGHSERLAIGGEGVVGNGAVEEMVNFWGSHSNGFPFPFPSSSWFLALGTRY